MEKYKAKIIGTITDTGTSQNDGLIIHHPFRGTDLEWILDGPYLSDNLTNKIIFPNVPGVYEFDLRIEVHSFYGSLYEPPEDEVDIELSGCKLLMPFPEVKYEPILAPVRGDAKATVE